LFYGEADTVMNCFGYFGRVRSIMLATSGVVVPRAGMQVMFSIVVQSLA
jgi:hypothetical protein